MSRLHLSREHVGQPEDVTGARMGSFSTSKTDFSKCEPDQAWLSRLNSDTEFLKEAIHAWRDYAHQLLLDIRRVAFTRRRASGGAVGEVRLTFEVPDAFNRLTDLFLVWCDTAQTGIQADPFLRYRDTVYSYSMGRRPYKSLEAIQKLLARCHRLLRRIRLAICLTPVEPPSGNHVDGEEYGKAEGVDDGSREHRDDDRVNDGNEDDRDPKNEKRGEFGLVVDERKRTISRKGYPKSVSLEGNPNLWHIFLVLFRAGRKQADLDKLKNGYPGEWNPNARNQAYHALRKKLKRVGMTVGNRQLVPIADA